LPPQRQLLPQSSTAATEPSSSLETAIDAFQIGAAGFQDVLAQLVAGVVKEREELAAARSALEAEREALECETNRVMQVYAQPRPTASQLGGFGWRHNREWMRCE
jgi:hypothetical protein